MKAAAALLVVIGLGTALALNTASCSSPNACAANAGAGGTSAGGTTAGGTGGSNCSAGTGGATSCDQLTAVQACFNAFCQADGAGTPFCTCFKRGYDLGAPPDCLCVPFDSAAFCNGAVGSSVDCSAVTSAVATQCVGVQ